MRHWRWMLSVVVLAGWACTDEAAERVDDATRSDVISAALTELFARRENARAITIWEDGREFAPTLAAYGGAFDAGDTLSLVSTAGLTLRVPFAVERTSLRDMQDFFRTDPEGWDAWFEAHPGNAGVVELAQPRIAGDSAQLVIGRACGEHCRTAWRLSLARTAGRWQVRVVDVLRVPR